MSLMSLMIGFGITGGRGRVAADSPTVANPLVDQNATSLLAFSYQFASNTFSDPAGGTLSYAAALSNGDPLPAWLSFTAGTRTLSGTPAGGDVGTVTVRVTATSDVSGLSGHDDFDVTITTAFNPATLPGTVAFAWSGGEKTLINDGSDDRLSAWGDTSLTTSFVQATAGKRPYDGASPDFRNNEYMLSDVNVADIWVPDVDQDYVVFTVYEADAIQGTLTFIANTTTASIVKSTTAGLSYLNSTPAETGVTGFWTDGPVNRKFVSYIEKSGANLTVWFNGLIVDSRTNAQAVVVSGSQGGQKIAIGANAAGTSPMDGRLSAVWIGKQALSEADRVALHAWASSELGATTPIVFTRGGQTPGQSPGGPMMLYEPTFDRIYQSWNGPNAEPSIMQYTISTGKWSKPYAIDVTANHHENHNVVALLRLPSGRLLAMHGCNSTSAHVRRTMSSDDITSWEDATDTISSTTIYPWLFNYNNVPQLIFRNGPYVQHHRNTYDEGETWNQIRAIIDGENPYWSWINQLDLSGDVLHIGGLISKGGRPRFQMYHVIYDLSTGSIRNASGSHTLAAGSLPITKTILAANDYLLDTAFVDENLDTDGSYGIGGARWQLDDGGDLHLVYKKRDNILIGGDGIARLYYNRTTAGADGGSWGTPTELMQIGDALSGSGAMKGDCSIRVRADGKIDVYAIDVTVFTQTSDHYEGSGALVWIHHNGTSWQAPAELMAEDEFREINNPVVIKGLPDNAVFHLRAGEVQGNDTSPTRAFLFGGATTPARVEFSAAFGPAVAGTTPVNLAPVVRAALSNQLATEDEAFSYQIPADTFWDPNLDALTLTVTQADDSPLPSWLSFDDVDTLSGTPDAGDVGTLSLKVTATDPGTLSVTASFDLVVNALSGYSAHPVNFDGSNDFLTREGNLTGVADGHILLFSCWFRRTSTGQLRLYGHRSSTTSRFWIEMTTGNLLGITGRNGSNTTVLAATGATAITDTNWHHVLISLDLSDTAKRAFLLDGVSDSPTWTTYNTAGTIDFSTSSPETLVGKATDATPLLWAGDLADLFFHTPATWFDPASGGNLAKFFSSGTPVDLGVDGSTPLGLQPLVCLNASTTAAWHTNVGSGGGFTENGALTDGTGPTHL